VGADTAPFGADTVLFGADTALVGGDTAPFGADTVLFGAETALVGADTAPFGGDTAPVGADTAPFGGDTAPVGADTAFVGVDTAPFGAETAPVGADTAHFGADTAFVGVDTAPFGADTVPFGADTVLFRADTALFGADTVLLGVDTAPFSADTAPFGADTVLSGKIVGAMSTNDDDPAAAELEARLHAATIGRLVPLTGPIVLVDYDPTWPRLFAREAERTRSALGDGVLGLEHVGSTSVPGLTAKPIIDIVLVVADSAHEPSYVPQLESAGYVLRIREPDWFQHRLFKGPDTNINMHVFSAGCPEIDRMLRFRDWLRDHDEDRVLYEHEKRALAQRAWRYVQGYADAKSRIVEEILGRAQKGGGAHEEEEIAGGQ
jgi:GrpB-like predicted nucleotidyltransferase (UPF0157 family)